MASFLTDSRSSSLPRLGGVVFLADGSGAAGTGGVTAPAFSDFSDYLAKGDTTPSTAAYSHDNLIAAGIKYMAYVWWAGQVALGAATDNNCAGNYPLDYPDTTAGRAASCTPITQVQHAAIAGSGYLNQIEPALNTAGRKGRLCGMEFYGGCPPASSAVDNTTLDSYSTIPELLGGHPAYDILGVVANANRCCPALMGGNCLGWWEANDKAYSDAGTTLATADATPIQQWTSLHPTASARTWSQATLGNRPDLKTNQINGYPCLRFNGTSDRMTLSSAMPATAAFTIAFVAKPGTADSMILGHTTLNRQVRFNDAGAARRIALFDGTSDSKSLAPAYTASAWHIFRCRYDGTNCRIYVDGTQVASYDAGPAFTSGMALDLLGCFGNGGASNFYDGDLAAMALIDASCTDNQIQLAEAYWANKYAITVSGSPVLPVKAHVERLFSARAVKVVREPWDRRDVSDLTGWDANGYGIVTNPDRMTYANASPTVYYTKASATGRASIYILNNGPSVSARTSTAIAALLLGIDVYMDFGGFSLVEITALKNAHAAIVDGMAGAAAGLYRRRSKAAFIRKRRAA